jgi:hypothetical protein
VPLFGEKKDPANEEDWFAAAQPMIEWASSVPRVDLAVEVMAVFGSVDSIGAREIYASMFGVPTEVPVLRGDPNVLRALERVEIPVREAVQLLEHAELVCGYLLDGSPFWVWRATRLGMATMDNGRHTVRQPFQDRTGL